ncbi:MAG: hypothetical protein QY314_00580 [Candidatus Dojkabacteria bacterium]|nr:MAG: hypothetical protein QY314_00580 [Candidatus Dojkabacteria bacterium]
MIYTQLYEHKSCSIVPCTAIVQRGIRKCTYNRPLKSYYQDFTPLLWHCLKQAGYSSYTHKIALFLETELEKVSAPEYQLPLFLSVLEQMEFIKPKTTIITNGIYRPALGKWHIRNDFWNTAIIPIENYAILPPITVTTLELIAHCAHLKNVTNKAQATLPTSIKRLIIGGNLIHKKVLDTCNVTNPTVISWFQRFYPDLVTQKGGLAFIIIGPTTLKLLKSIPAEIKGGIHVVVDLNHVTDLRQAMTLFQTMEYFSHVTILFPKLERTPHTLETNQLKIHDYVLKHLSLFSDIQYAQNENTYRSINTEETTSILTL